MRAGIYYRVSSEEQIDGFSLDAQRRILLDYCQHKGWRVAEEYADEGKSARTHKIERRPAFQRMMEDVEANLLDVVVVHKIDRFSRNIRVTFEYLELLARHSVGFVAVAQPDLDYTRPEGRLFMGMMVTLAQYYSDNLAQETRKGKAERKAQGFYNGHIPFGMMKGGDGIPVANPEAIDGLRLAFQLASEGRSDRDVAQALNDAGYRTNGNRGNNPFTKDTVCAILQNRFYLGELPGARPDDVAPVKHAAVIDRDLFAAAQEQRERRAVGGRQGVRRAATVYSLSGLAVCHQCGSAMHIQPSRGKARIYCSGRRQGSTCVSRSAALEQYETQLGAHFARFVIPANYWDRLRLFVAEESKKAYVETAVHRARLEKQMARLKDLYRLGDIERAEYLEERNRVQRDLAALAAEQVDGDTRLGDLAALLENVAQGWTLATQEQRNRLARLVFEEIVINDNRVVAVKPRPELGGFFALNCQIKGQCIEGAEVTGVKRAPTNASPRRTSAFTLCPRPGRRPRSNRGSPQPSGQRSPRAPSMWGYAS